MTSEIQDRNDELRRVNAEMEESIGELMREHEHYSDTIAHNLINFRKACINESCTEYGAIYKEKKSEFTSLIINQNEKFKLLRNEVKLLQKSIRNVMVESLKSAAQALDSADEAEKSMKNAKMESEMAKNDSSASKELNDKLESLEQESAQLVDEMRRAQRKEFEKSKLELLRHIRALLTERKPLFKDLRNAAALYENDIAEFRDDHHKLVEEMNSLRSDTLEKRRLIMLDTNKAIDSIKSEIKAIKDRAEINRMGFEALRANMLKQRGVREVESKKVERMLKKQAHTLKKQRHEALRNRECGFKEQEEEFERRELSEKEKLNAKFVEHRNALDWVQTKVQEASDDTSQIIGHLKSLIGQSLRTQTLHTVGFRKNIEEQESKISKLLTKWKNDYISEREACINRINEEIDLLANASYEKEHNQIEALRKELENVNTETEGRIDQTKADFESKREEARSGFAREKESKRKILQRNMERKADDLSKAVMSIAQKLQKELQEKKTVIVNETAAKLDAEVNNLKQTNLEENDEMQTTISQLKARLIVIEKGINNHLNLSKKQLEKLDEEIVSLEKRKRKFERSKKAEIQSIDENYEMKIQIEQVSLREKIENISKLYTEEENMRGRELIEAIRKVKEMENRRLNTIVDKNRRLEEMRKQMTAQKEALQQDIQQYTNSFHETNLEEQIKKVSDQTNETIGAIKSDSKQTCDKIKERISAKEHDMEQKQKAIKDQIAQENADFESKTHEIAHRKQQIKEHTEKEREQTEKNFEEQRLALMTRHKRDVENMKARIASAESVQKEYIEKTKAVRSELIERFEAEASQRMNEATESVKSKANKALSESVMKLEDTRGKLEDTMVHAFLCPMKDDSPYSQEIRQRRSKLGEKNAQLEKAFDQHISKMTEIWSQEHQMPDTPTRRKLISISSDNCFRRIPLVVTPQII